jgi:hypothetical protein
MAAIAGSQNKTGSSYDTCSTRSDVDEQSSLLGCYALFNDSYQRFGEVYCLYLQGQTLKKKRLFYHEHEGSTLSRNVGNYLPLDTVQCRNNDVTIYHFRPGVPQCEVSVARLHECCNHTTLQHPKTRHRHTSYRPSVRVSSLLTYILPPFCPCVIATDIHLTALLSVCHRH